MKTRFFTLLCVALLAVATGCQTAPAPLPEATTTTSATGTSGTEAIATTVATTVATPASSAETTGSSASVAATTATARTTVATKSTAKTSTTAATTAVPVQTTTTTTTTTTTATTTTATARKEVTVTIPEGYTFMQIANLLEQNGVCTAVEFYNTCQNYTPQSFTIPTGTNRCFRMEGYLFPDTYRFYVNDNPQSVLIRMLNNYHSKVGNLSDDTLILASIIEREARSDKHMKLVSSVYHNRLNNPAAFPYLNADPTRDYVNKYITGNSLVSNQSSFAALYNTCNKRKGLPAGPICNPGLRAIRAAKEPAESSYYYFFYGADGENHYSETLEEHNRLIAEIGVG